MKWIVSSARSCRDMGGTGMHACPSSGSKRECYLIIR